MGLSYCSAMKNVKSNNCEHWLDVFTHSPDLYGAEQ